MYDTAIAVAGIIGFAWILSVTVYVNGRLRIEQQRTLQRVLDRGVSVDALSATADFPQRADRDRRRGIALVAVGLLWSLVTFFIGGRAWTFGAVPVVLGLVCLVFWKLDDRPR